MCECFPVLVMQFLVVSMAYFVTMLDHFCPLGVVHIDFSFAMHVMKYMTKTCTHYGYSKYIQKLYTQNGAESF